MKSRSYWYPEFKFTTKQRKALRGVLTVKSDKKDRFIDLVQARAQIVKIDLKKLLDDPIPLPGKIHQEIEELEHAVADCEARLDGIDPLGIQASLDVAFVRMGFTDPGGFIEDLQQRLLALQTALQVARSRVPKPGKGRPEKDFEIGFVAEIALDYERVFGKLPPRGRYSSFHLFMREVFRYVDYYQEDCSRIVAKALDRIKSSRE